jgi:hypothetical protein
MCILLVHSTNSEICFIHFYMELHCNTHAVKIWRVKLCYNQSRWPPLSSSHPLLPPILFLLMQWEQEWWLIKFREDYGSQYRAREVKYSLQSQSSKWRMVPINWNYEGHQARTFGIQSWHAMSHQEHFFMQKLRCMFPEFWIVFYELMYFVGGSY